MGSAFSCTNRLLWFATVDGDQVGVFCSIHRSSSSETVTLPAALPRRRVSSAATRSASRFPARTVRLTWVGRPWESRPVKDRTSQTPLERSRMVATGSTVAE